MTLLTLLHSVFKREEPTRIPNWRKTELDFRRDLVAPEHNPGFDMKARRQTAELTGVKI